MRKLRPPRRTNSWEPAGPSELVANSVPSASSLVPGQGGEVWSNSQGESVNTPRVASLDKVALEKLADSIAEELDFGLPDESGKESALQVNAEAKAEVPELVSALKQLRQRLNDLKDSVHGTMDRFAEPEAILTKWGSGSDNIATYVEMKVQMLLGYLVGLSYYMFLKTKGMRIREHPLVPRLVWIRTVLEKLKPVDARVQYQINKLLQWDAARKAGNTAAAKDPLELRPGELAAGVEDEEDQEVEQADGHGVYRPPRIAQAEFTGDHMSLNERAERNLERKRERLERSEFVRSLREEFTDAPAELHHDLRSADAEKSARKMALQQEYEEEYFVRVRESNKQAKAEKRLQRRSNLATAGTATLDDAAADFDQINQSLVAARGRGGRGRRGRGRSRGGSVLQEYKDASDRAAHSRRVVDSTEHGNLGDFGPVKRLRGQRGSSSKRRKK